MNVVTLIVLILVLAIGAVFYLVTYNELILPVFIPLALLLAASPRIVKQWERGIILRLGKFHRNTKPGLTWLVPLIDRLFFYVDQRVITTSFLAEKALTKDTVPVNVDAVLFWHVWDAEKATLQVKDYWSAVSWAAQTALRDMIGRTELAELLSAREELDKQLQVVIDAKTEPWGITVQSVEIRDVVIPESLQDAMSRQAQAERERQARVILGDAESQIALKFVEAGRHYEAHPDALQLRAMNFLYESLKEKGTMVIVPSSTLDNMSIGGVAGMTALARQELGTTPESAAGPAISDEEDAEPEE